MYVCIRLTGELARMQIARPENVKKKVHGGAGKSHIK